MKSLPRFGLVLWTMCSVASLFAEDAVEPAQPVEQGPLEGHSLHGEVFNEGPRQAAYLMGGTGNVHFEATCATPEVQQFIDQGVGQLHGFWYFESERTFRQAAMLDPQCAIAYWGMAMSNRTNETRARGFIEEAMKRKEQVTPREQAHIVAWSEFFKEPTAKQKEDKDHEKKRRQTLVEAYERLLFDHPDDLEAKAFLSLIIYENKAKGIPISSYFAVDALMRDVLDQNPLHPCHHFRIHLWDYEKPEQSLDSAALCGASAPAIAHMWHMPGHIYSRVRRYHDAVWQQEASARVDHAHMMRDRVLPDQIHNFAHNNEWLIRNLIHIGDVNRALDLARNMSDLPRHPKYNTLSKQGSAYYGRLRMFEILEEFEMWDLASELSATRYLEPTDEKKEQDQRLLLVAVASFQTNRTLSGTDILTEIKLRLSKLREEEQAAVTAAEAKAREEQKDDKDIKGAQEEARRKFSEELRRLEQMQFELEGYVHAVSGAHADALAAFKKVSGLHKVRLAQAQWAAGEQEPALVTLRNHVKDHQSEVLPLAHLIRMLWDAEKRDEAQQLFDELRKLSAVVDLSVPAMQRLAPIAQELKLPVDWRLPLERASDFGERPSLDSLGPFRWSPSPAPQWELVDHVGNKFTLVDYRGKPVVVIFFLGHSCLHCAEQLQKFAPLRERFKQEGIELIGVSTDAIANLKLSQENYGDEPFPFPLVSNSELDVFKAYRCFDDFEKLTLHGTFLIDAEGLMRWQDISFEPFMEPEFILREAARQLTPAVPSPVTPTVTSTGTGAPVTAVQGSN